MQIKVLLFAEARDLAEADSIEIELAASEATKSEIFDAVKRAAGCLEQILDTCNLAYNHQYIGDEKLSIKESDELALIPPIGGG